MQNKSEFWNENLHLEGIKNLIVSMIEKKEENFTQSENFKLNNLAFEIKLESKVKEKKLIVNCNDGRTLSIKLELKDKKNSYVHSYKECLVQCEYIYKAKNLKKEEKLEFISNPMRVVDTFGLSYIEAINLINTIRYEKYNEYNRLRTVDYLNNGVIIYIVFTSECAFKYNYIITPDLIYANDTKNNFMISNDYKLLKINEKDVVDYEQLKRFNSISELKKIREIVKNNSSNLNPLTTQSLDTIMIDLTKQEEFAKLAINFYENGGLTTLKEAVRDFNKMFEFAENHVFSEEELLNVYNILSKNREILEKDDNVNTPNVKVLNKKIK